MPNFNALKPIVAAAAFAYSICATPSHAEIKDDFAVVSPGLTMHYQITGSGPTTLVFVPGWTMTTAAFEHQMSHYEDSDDYTVLTFDPRAQGLTTRTTEGHYYEQHAKDLKALLDHFEVEKPVLIGWSSGGGEVLEFVRLYGVESVKGVALIDTTPKPRGTDNTQEWVWFGTKDEGDQDAFFRAYSLDIMVDRLAVSGFFAEWMLENPTQEAIDFVESMAFMTPDSIAALLNTSYWFLDNTAEVKALNEATPLLYLTRIEWEGFASAWAAENTPNAEVAALGKHMMFWERPDEFNAMMDSWLTKHFGK